MVARQFSGGMRIRELRVPFSHVVMPEMIDEAECGVSAVPTGRESTCLAKPGVEPTGYDRDPPGRGFRRGPQRLRWDETT
jgi:hypothetical protein